MSWVYDSGGKTKHQNKEKYEEGYQKIFTAEWPCPKCEGTRIKGHKDDCPNHWRNK